MEMGIWIGVYVFRFCFIAYMCFRFFFHVNYYCFSDRRYKKHSPEMSPTKWLGWNGLIIIVFEIVQNNSIVKAVCM